MSELKALVARVPGRKFLGKGWFLVGGAIRDALLNKPVMDWDIVVPGDPEPVARALARALGRVPLVQLDEGVFRVIPGEAWVDVARMEGASIEEDLARRDFTVNAMALTPRGRLVDPLRGREDLAAGVLRTPRRENLAQDPLRCLRAFRFVSEMGFGVSDETLSFIRSEAKGLADIPGERVWFELKHLFNGRFLKNALLSGWETGVLGVILPELRPMDETWGGNNLLRHSINAAAIAGGVLRNLEITPFAHYKSHLSVLDDPSARAVFLFAALVHDVGKPETYTHENGEVHFYGHDALGARMARAMARRLRMSKAERNWLVLLVANHMHPHFLGQGEGPTRRAMNRFLRRVGEWAFPVILLAYADALSTQLSHQGVVAHLVLAKNLHDFIEEMEREKKKKPRLITGHDLIAMGLEPGPVFKKILQEIDDLRAEGKLRTRDEALDAARRMIRQV